MISEISVLRVIPKPPPIHRDQVKALLRRVVGSGEAGAVTTDESELRAKIQVLFDHGQATKHLHSIIGWNARMDGIQAAV